MNTADCMTHSFHYYALSIHIVFISICPMVLILDGAHDHYIYNGIMFCKQVKVTLNACMSHCVNSSTLQVAYLDYIKLHMTSQCCPCKISF